MKSDIHICFSFEELLAGNREFWVNCIFIYNQFIIQSTDYIFINIYFWSTNQNLLTSDFYKH